MIEFLYRRIMNNKWLFFCLLLGILLTTAVISALPMYSSAILQKVLTKDLENEHIKTSTSPGLVSILVKGDGLYSPDIVKSIHQIDALAETKYKNAYDLTRVEDVNQLRFDRLFLQRTGDDYFNRQDFYAYPTYLKNIQEHVTLSYGVYPKAKACSGEEITESGKSGNSDTVIYEVLVSNEALKRMQLVIDKTYSLVSKNKLSDDINEVIEFKIVGVFTVIDKNELFWSNGRYDTYLNNLLFQSEDLESIANNNPYMRLKDYEQSYFYDYHEIKLEDIQTITNTYRQQLSEMKTNGIKLFYLQFPVIQLLSAYVQRQVELRITLWILMVPLIIIMCFYALIISHLIIENDKNEIAVLKSRGAKRYQIFFLYIVECLVLSIVSMAVGPYLGYVVCKILGASNGFLEFVSRKGLELRMSVDVYVYAFYATCIFSVFVLAPAFKASHTSIVQYKRSLLDKNKKPLWKKFYVDFMILATSIYGVYLFNQRKDILSMTGLSGSEVKIDPLLFFISTFFILGMSLMVLRIYPLLIQMIFYVGQKKWNPILYFSLVNVSKADRNLQSIMLFIILTLSFGIINANQARTINSNIMDRVMYKNGAEIVVEPFNNLKHAAPDLAPNALAEPVKPTYQEPPYQKYTQLNGIETATKVINTKESEIVIDSKHIKNVHTLAVTPNEFGKVVWSRSDLLPFHINDYLNIMTEAKKAVYVSTSFKDAYDLKIGDLISVVFPTGKVECMVYGFVDYFPTYNPFTPTGAPSFFVVMNYQYVDDLLPTQPYEIWMKKSAGITDTQINDELVKSKLFVERVDYSSQEIIAKKNAPMLLGTNGILTMCFIITMLTATVGFIIFWALSIRERSLKFGIFRAIGMPMSHVSLIMVCEQILVSGVAIVVGFGLGTFASKIFIPLLEIFYSSAEQVPVFKIVAYPSDYFKVLIITLIMVISGLIVLARMVKGIKINQVIKLGEDS